jgi:EIX receptor 1/2
MLEGMIPKGINHCTRLAWLRVSQNKLNGSLDIDFPISVRVFSAHSNNFFGTLPTSLANCTKLQLLDLRENRLTGELPKFFASFHDMRVLSVGHNNLHGCFPQWITNLTKLQVLDLSNNNFSGSVPSHLETLQGFTINGSTPLPYEMLYEHMRIYMKGVEYSLTYELQRNTIFDVSNNNLTGEIPTSMGSLNNMRLLNLSRNQLEGQIPASISEISTLEQLDLAKNNLSGWIPQELSKLTMLASLDISSNRLCGPIPIGTQFDTFSETSFQRNKCLCGYPLQACMHQKRRPGEDLVGRVMLKGVG